MYICPICQQNIEREEYISKHFLECWKRHNPNHRSKPAPQSPDVEIRQGEENALAFFAQFK